MDFLTDPVTFISQWVQQLLINLGIPEITAAQILPGVGAVILPLLAMLWVIFLIWYERKIIGRLQDRPGPNRVGPFGLFQPFADMAKIFTKEHITPTGADKVPYNLAPILAVGGVLGMWAVVPFSATVFGIDINVGALYIIAVGSIGTLGIIFAGYASNNKYAMLGAFRVVAQLISYEIPMVLALLVPVLLSRSMGMNSIVQAQPVWFLVVAPLPALLFFISSIAEVGRSPFDLAEAESEIVAGFNIEYSGLKFGMFFVGEFLHAFTNALIFTALFLGGWQGPGAEQYPILGFVYFILKTLVVHFLGIAIRGSMPRFRIDQVMQLNWKIFTPIALLSLCSAALVEKLAAGAGDLVRISLHVAANLVIFGVVILVGTKSLKERNARLDDLAASHRSAIHLVLGTPHDA
ncbi:MAG: NADH-quinone oxidoreductase subunit NuoH [Anaerolinea sp.]|nr:NADH-quinone oxidoreductase subunit NuoH [Anaerolinea sp.]